MSESEPPFGTPWHAARFVPSFSRFWRGYVVFRGRAARAEYWWWALWWAILSLIVNVFYVIGLFSSALATPSLAQQRTLEQALDSSNPFPVWGYLLSSLPPVSVIALGVFAAVGLASLLPWIALTVRRLHDSNRSGWWILLSLVPMANVVLFVFLVLPSDPRGSRFDGGSPARTRG